MKSQQTLYNKAVEIMVQAFEVGKQQPESYHPVELATGRGTVHCRYYTAGRTQYGAIWVGGIGGNWDTPAQGLYPRLCQELTEAGIASLRVCFRYSTNLVESILDVMAGLKFLQDEGIESVALIGHSFGGAVVIQAGIRSEAVRTVVTLATQSYGADVAPELATRCSLLLLHGTADQVLTPKSSQHIYQLALEPKHLILYPGARHGLDEVADDVYQVVQDWILSELRSCSLLKNPKTAPNSTIRS